MIRPTFDENEDKPLDPAVEKVRRKLVRFVAVNLGLLAIALMAVALAVVYKWRAGDVGQPASFALAPDAPPVEGEIALPAGAKLVGQALSGDRVLLTVQLQDGSQAVYLYDIARRQMVGRFAVVAR